MVASPNALASQAGLRILQAGGSAVDAAIATSATLAVLYPHMAGLGGDLFALVYDAASGRVSALNASGRAAARATIDWYRARGHRRIPARGPLAALTVPGAVDGWGELHACFGRLDLEQILEPAIGHAANGAPVGRSLALWCARDLEVISQQPACGSIYLSANGQPWRFGQVLRQPGLERCLREIGRRGCRALYDGPLAEEVAGAASQAGGPLTAEDFARHTSTWVEPIQGFYRGQTVYQMPPNTQGMAAIEILQVADGWDIAEFGEGTTAYYHHLVEATRQAFLDRDRYLTDPSFSEIPLDRLLSAEHAATLRARVDSFRAGGARPSTAGGDTTYLCAADRDGNLVSLIHSIYWDFGSAFIAGDTGIILQNRGAFFSLDPEHPNRLEPGKRTFHTLIPAMLAREGTPWLAYGSMGGEGQPQTQAALVTRIVDFGFDLQAAVEGPRWLLGRVWGVEDSKLHLEGRIPATIAAELHSMGHDVVRAADWDELFGHAQAIARDESGLLRGAADPRGDGAAVGY
ncbi:MAG: gamma-glutamyltransferase [Chloroflexi bacterium]|nr:gamma-glutamyltransferase [Chloroflexota bacterium]